MEIRVKKNGGTLSQKKLNVNLHKNTYFSENPLKFTHPKDETIFTSAEAEIKRYLSSHLSDRIFGRKIRIAPSFLANSLKYITSVNILIDDGEITDSSSSRKALLRTFALIGEGYRGGYGYDTTTAFPLHDSEEAARRAFWFSNFLAVQNAYKKYAQLFGRIERARRDFDILSREKKVVDIQKVVTNDEMEIANLNFLIDVVRNASKYISSFPEIVDSACEIKIDKVLQYFINSEGTKIKTSSLYISVILGGLVYDNLGELELERSFYKRDWTIDFEKIKECSKEIVNALLEMKRCRREEAGTYPLLIDGQAHGVIWHEGVGHLLEKDPDKLEEGETFSRKIGKKVAPHFINLVCDPTLKNAYGSYKYDDEGIRGRKITLIEKGVLKRFLHSRLTAGRQGKCSTGHARVGDEESDELPTPRMSNLIVLPSSSHSLSFAELKRKLIAMARKKGQRYGIYCKGFTHGAVEIESGKNEIHPLEIFRIYTNGKIERVKDVYIIGTPYTLINKLVACGKDFEHSPGYCFGKSGKIPTEEIAPPALFDDVEFARVKRNERGPFLRKP